MKNHLKPLRAALTASILAAAPLAPSSALAGPDPFIGEIMMVGYTFCPRGWADANGQLLPIAQNSALFSLYGTTFGGDGRTTFALPDLRGRAPIRTGQGPGLSNRQIGARGGSETNTLTVSQLPRHTHGLTANSGGATTGAPAGAVLADTGRDDIYASAAPDVSLGTAAVGSTGGGQAVNNMPPFTTIRFCVALNGVYPSRN